MSNERRHYNAVLSEGTMNRNMLDMQYAVRGELAVRAGEIEKQLKQGQKFPFDSITYCNIGNPQAVGQSPLTFNRQVLAACMCPWLLENPATKAALPEDVVQRAEKFLANSKGMGAYSNSKGLDMVRESVASYIGQRDGYPAEVEHIFLTNGASEGVKLFLNMLISDQRDAILVPIPQYPLYSAGITLLGGTRVSYPLVEDDSWGIDLNDLKEVLRDARHKGLNVKALVVINPGNPTGQVLSEENMQEIVKFCHQEQLLLMADEVYQSNIYAEGKKFVSFKKVLMDLKLPLEMVSFHSVSKGMLGECGLRGGYYEAVNIKDEIVAQLYKAASVNLCPNVPGQMTVELMVNPPKEGDASYDLYQKEYTAIFEGLKRKATKLAAAFNSMPGISCNQSEGAMYLFPRIRFPPKAVAAAAGKGKKIDNFYCMELLNATGICVVPGSGFGQEEGTFHIRITFLPSEDQFDKMIERFSDFHSKFMAEYGGSKL